MIITYYIYVDITIYTVAVDRIWTFFKTSSLNSLNGNVLGNSPEFQWMIIVFTKKCQNRGDPLFQTPPWYIHVYTSNC